MSEDLTHYMLFFLGGRKLDMLYSGFSGLGLDSGRSLCRVQSLPTYFTYIVLFSAIDEFNARGNAVVLLVPYSVKIPPAF